MAWCRKVFCWCSVCGERPQLCGLLTFFDGCYHVPRLSNLQLSYCKVKMQESKYKACKSHLYSFSKLILIALLQKSCSKKNLSRCGLSDYTHTHKQLTWREKGRRGSYETLYTHSPPPPCRSAFTVAVVGSAVVVRYQVTQRRKQQEARGSRPSEKLSWEERVVIEEQKMSRTPPQAPASDNENGMYKSCFAVHCACGNILRGYQVLKPLLVSFVFMFVTFASGGIHCT